MNCATERSGDLGQWARRRRVVELPLREGSEESARLSQVARSLRRFGFFEHAEKAARVAKRKARFAQCEGHPELFSPRETRQPKRDRRTEESIAESIVDTGPELLEDLEALAYPLRPTAESAGDPPLRDFPFGEKRGEQIELFAKRRLAPRIVSAQSLEDPIGAAPFAHQGPHALATRSAACEEALESVDEKVAASVALDEDDDRIIPR